MVSPIEEEGAVNIYMVSDRLKATKGRLTVRVLDLKGNVISEKTKQVTVPANTSKIQYTAPTEELLNGKARNEVFIHARFQENGQEQEVITNNYFLTRYKDISFPKAVIQTESVAAGDGFDVTLRCDVFARAVFLSLDGIDNFFSDNYFDLIPGEAVTIHVTTSLDKATFDRQLQCISICDAF